MLKLKNKWLSTYLVAAIRLLRSDRSNCAEILVQSYTSSGWVPFVVQRYWDVILTQKRGEFGLQSERLPATSRINIWGLTWTRDALLCLLDVWADRTCVYFLTPTQKTQHSKQFLSAVAFWSNWVFFPLWEEYKHGYKVNLLPLWKKKKRNTQKNRTMSFVQDLF